MEERVYRKRMENPYYEPKKNREEEEEDEEPSRKLSKKELEEFIRRN